VPFFKQLENMPRLLTMIEYVRSLKEKVMFLDVTEVGLGNVESDSSSEALKSVNN